MDPVHVPAHKEGRTLAICPCPGLHPALPARTSLPALSTPGNTPGLTGCPRGDSASGEGMLSPSSSTFLEYPEGSWALPHWGMMAMVPISFLDRQWLGACGRYLTCIVPSCASSFTGGAAPAVPPSHCLLCCPAACTGSGATAPSASPLGTCFPVLLLICLVWDMVSCSAGFVLLMAIEMPEQGEETGLSMRLWGRIRC